MGEWPVWFGEMVRCIVDWSAEGEQVSDIIAHAWRKHAEGPERLRSALIDKQDEEIAVLQQTVWDAIRELNVDGVPLPDDSKALAARLRQDLRTRMEEIKDADLRMGQAIQLLGGGGV